MATGRESKAVADQMEQTGERASSTETPPVRSDELEALRLSRARTLDQLARATNPHHRQMLERALSALDAKLGEME